MNNKINEPTAGEKIRWQTIVAKYAKPDMRKSLWQVANTLIPYFVLWYIMIRTVEVSYALTLALSVLAAGFLMRAFITFII